MVGTKNYATALALEEKFVFGGTLHDAAEEGGVTAEGGLGPQFGGSVGLSGGVLQIGQEGAGKLLPILRRQKGRLQTAGLICAPELREELTSLLLRVGVTRITRAGSLSDSFPGEAHDGEYPLQRYTRVVDIEV